MTHRERIQAIKEGRRPDRPAFSAWGHVMNLTDLHAGDFARATIDFQNANDFDFVKVMSNPYYMIEDMGLELVRPADYLTPTGRNYDTLPIQKPLDWETIQFPDLNKGSLYREKEAIKRIVDHFRGETPVLPSVFSPFTWVQYLAIHGAKLDEAWYKTGSCLPAVEEYLIENERYIRSALERFQELNIRYMEELLSIGVDGFFYAIEYSDDVWSSEDSFESFVKQYDMEALEKTADKSFFTMLHACGDKKVRLDRLADYPVDAINWSDTSPENPTIAEAVKVMKQIPVGGLDHRRDLKGADRERIVKTLHDRIDSALSATEGRVIISGGCAWTVEDTYRFGLWRDVLREYESK